MGAGDVSLKSVFICFAASPCTQLSRALSTTSESDFAPWRLPFSGIILIVRHTRSASCADQAHSGSPSSLGASLSERAVLTDPAAVSGPPRLLRCAYWCLPATTMLSACGQILNEAQSLHFRYGSSVALSTLSPIRYLLRPKTRFPVRRLHLLSGREFHPLEAPGFVLAHCSA